MNYYSNSNAVIIAVSGPQAARYLQARLSNNILTLDSNHACLAAALSPQGRTEGLFAVVQNGKNEFFLYADGGNPSEILTSLRKFIVTERVDTVLLSPEQSIVHLSSSGTLALASLGFDLPQEVPELTVVRGGPTVAIRRARTTMPGWDVICSPAVRQALLAELSTQSTSLPPEQQTLERLRAGIPVFPDEINSEHILLESGLTAAVSFTKGCYTGQEVIAKIDALGKPPRLLKRLQIQGKGLTSGSAVTVVGKSQPIGELVTVAFDPQTCTTLAFAYIRNNIDLSASDLSVGNFSAHALE